MNVLFSDDLKKIEAIISELNAKNGVPIEGNITRTMAAPIQVKNGYVLLEKDINKTIDKSKVLEKVLNVDKDGKKTIEDKPIKK